MPLPELTIEAIEPAEGDPQLNIQELEYNEDANLANYLARNCFLLKVRKRNQIIICKVLLGPADQKHGHTELDNHYNTRGFQTGGGGMLWITPAHENEPELHIGSHSERFYSVPPEILELVKIPIAEVLRMSGAQFRQIILCPTKEPHPIWEREPYNELIN